MRSTRNNSQAPAAFSSADLLAFKRGAGEWLVEGRLPSGGTSFLVGEPGVGKSSAVRELALAVSRGAPWLRFSTIPGPVLYVSIGESLAAIRESFVSLGLNPADDIHILPVAPGQSALERVRALSQTLEPVLVIVDSLQPLLEAEDLNDNRVSPLDRVLHRCHAPGMHLLLVHSLAIGQQRDLSTMLAATARTIDTLFVLRKDGGRRLLYSVQRKGADIRRPLVLPSRGRTEAALEDAVDPCVDLVIRREILDYLRRTSRLVTSQEIFAYVGHEEGKILSTLQQLKGRCEVLEVGGSGTPLLYTGCDPVQGGGSRLRRVRPWATIPAGL
jgi:hypothetical protein